MFTGLVQTLAAVVRVDDEPPGKRIVVEAAGLGSRVQIGDSIAVNGCCLTAVGVEGKQIAFQAGPETLARTNLGRLNAGRQVNLEPSLRVGDQLGGHFVTGHIDGIATLAERLDDRDWSTLWFRVDRRLTLEMVAKGSVAVDGVSLTLVDVEDERFSVALIPHTLQATTLGQMRVGDQANIETDVLAKYVQKYLARQAGPG